MIPRLRVELHEGVLRGKILGPKARASGYSHSYFDHEGLDPLALSTYPSDADIELASQGAAKEANSLIVLLGVNPDSLHHNPHAPSVLLLRVSSWLKDSCGTLDLDDSDFESNDDLSENDEELEAQQLRCLLDKESRSITRTRRVDDRCLNMTLASLTLPRVGLPPRSFRFF